MKTRAEELRNISGQRFELCVIGGGATGSACALDAQLRGIRTVLIEAGDFAGATSSAATKIIHGGVRDLEEAIRGLDFQEYHVLVRALHERVRMLENAHHLTRMLESLVPSYHWIDVGYLDIGEKTLPRAPSLRRNCTSPGCQIRDCVRKGSWADNRVSGSPAHDQTDHRRTPRNQPSLLGSTAACAPKFRLVIGACSERCGLVPRASHRSSSQKEHEQIYPKPGWVEHNAVEIWQNTRAVIAE